MAGRDLERERRQREEFRQRLVNLICNKDDDHLMEVDEIPSAEEREMLRYYYYVKHGVDTIHVAPMDEKILSMVNFVIVCILPSKEDAVC
ncbi:hypothetical protein NQ317_013622 [Molorchus minor]|uniref:Uncharacterized protein n=1 Tax=Molorchus minor TaxID=1323400 RepID=A0ABQ9JSY6_9CUCU|nr:hypothetical protein NQ317_013622 [Molorchus minor]